MQEIKKWEGETPWEIMKRFKDIIGKISYTIDQNNQRDSFIQSLLPLTKTSLMQQNINMFEDALE